MSLFNRIEIRAGTEERMSETCIELTGTQPKEGEALRLNFWVNGPYEFDQDEPASIVVKISAPDKIPDGWSQKDVERQGYFSVPIPVLLELLTEALISRKHTLSDEEFRSLVSAAVEALKPMEEMMR